MIVNLYQSYETFSFTWEADGTAYRLVVVFDRVSHNIKSIAWPDMRWSVGDFGREVSAEWLHSQGRLKSKKDAKNIAEVVNHLANVRAVSDGRAMPMGKP